MIDVSIILPCKDKADLLEGAVFQIEYIMKKSKYSYEILLAEDGSTDGTDIIAKKLSQKNKYILHIHSVQAKGRGKAISDALFASHGRIVGYLDPDLQIPAFHLTELIHAVDDGADLVNTLRTTTPYDVDFRYYVHYLLSMGFRYLVKFFFWLPINDIVSSCKFFRREKIMPVLSHVKDMSWFWDVEVLVFSYKEHLLMREVPVKFFRKIFQKRKTKKRIFFTIFSFFYKLILLRAGAFFYNH